MKLHCNPLLVWETVSADLGVAKNTALVDASFQDLGSTMKDAEQGVGSFTKQLDRLVAQSIKMHLMKRCSRSTKNIRGDRS